MILDTRKRIIVYNAVLTIMALLLLFRDIDVLQKVLVVLTLAISFALAYMLLKRGSLDIGLSTT